VHRVGRSDVASLNTAVGATVAQVFLCRVARAWNQTGDKWAHLPDVSDWLVRQVFISYILTDSGAHAAGVIG